MLKDKLKKAGDWSGTANIVLKGKKIVSVGYMGQTEADNYGWSKRPVTFILDDDTRLIVMRDDEGNDGGALAYINEGVDSVLPVLTSNINSRS